MAVAVHTHRHADDPGRKLAHARALVLLRDHMVKDAADGGHWMKAQRARRAWEHGWRVWGVKVLSDVTDKLDLDRVVAEAPAAWEAAITKAAKGQPPRKPKSGSGSGSSSSQQSQQPPPNTGPTVAQTSGVPTAGQPGDGSAGGGTSGQGGPGNQTVQQDVRDFFVGPGDEITSLVVGGHGKGGEGESQAVAAAQEQAGGTPQQATAAQRRAAMQRIKEQLMAQLDITDPQFWTSGPGAGAIQSYIQMALAEGADAGQYSLDQLGLNETFSWASPRTQGQDLFEVRGSKVVQQVADQHLDRLSSIIADATNPASPAGVDAVKAQIQSEWSDLKGWQAERIARTETANVWEATNYNAMMANGVPGYTTLLADSAPNIDADTNGACDLCIEMAAGGAVMGIGDAASLPPFHPNCRCTAVPHLDVTDPNTGETRPWLPPQEPWTGQDYPGLGPLPEPGGDIPPGYPYRPGDTVPGPGEEQAAAGLGVDYLRGNEDKPSFSGRGARGHAEPRESAAPEERSSPPGSGGRYHLVDADGNVLQESDYPHSLRGWRSRKLSPEERKGTRIIDTGEAPAGPLAPGTVVQTDNGVKLTITGTTRVRGETRYLVVQREGDTPYPALTARLRTADGDPVPPPEGVVAPTPPTPPVTPPPAPEPPVVQPPAPAPEAPVAPAGGPLTNGTAVVIKGGAGMGGTISGTQVMGNGETWYKVAVTGADGTVRDYPVAARDLKLPNGDQVPDAAPVAEWARGVTTAPEWRGENGSTITDLQAHAQAPAARPEDGVQPVSTGFSAWVQRGDQKVSVWAAGTADEARARIIKLAGDLDTMPDRAWRTSRINLWGDAQRSPGDARAAIKYRIPNFRSAATATGDRIDFWSGHQEEDTLWHELGHTSGGTGAFDLRGLPAAQRSRFKMWTQGEDYLDVHGGPAGGIKGVSEWAQAALKDADAQHEFLARPDMAFMGNAPSFPKQFTLGGIRNGEQVQGKSLVSMFGTNHAPRMGVAATQYGGTMIEEDWAESVMLYMTDRKYGRLAQLMRSSGRDAATGARWEGGVVDVRYADLYPERAKILDQVFSAEGPRVPDIQDALRAPATGEAVIAPGAGGGAEAKALQGAMGGPTELFGGEGQKVRDNATRVLTRLVEGDSAWNPDALERAGFGGNWSDAPDDTVRMLENLRGRWEQDPTGSVQAQALQRVIADVTGHGIEARLPANITQAEIDALLAQPGVRDSLEVYVREQYALTQRYLERKGWKEVRLYRGIRGAPDGMKTGVAVADTGAIGTASSWSTDYQAARTWGTNTFGVSSIESAVVPADRIFAVPQTGLGANRVREVVVLNDPGDTATFLVMDVGEATPKDEAEFLRRTEGAAPREQVARESAAAAPDDEAYPLPGPGGLAKYAPPPDDITTAEFHAVTSYQAGAPLSDKLRGKRISAQLKRMWGQYMESAQSGMDSLMARSVVQEDMRVVRAADHRWLGGGEPSVGDTFTDKGYVSTTADPVGMDVENWLHNEYIIDIHVPAGTHGFSMNDVRDADPNPPGLRLPRWDAQHEFVIDRGYEFRVTAVDGNRVTVEVVPRADEAPVAAPAVEAPSAPVPEQPAPHAEQPSGRPVVPPDPNLNMEHQYRLYDRNGNLLKTSDHQHSLRGWRSRKMTPEQREGSTIVDTHAPGFVEPSAPSAPLEGPSFAHREPPASAPVSAPEPPPVQPAPESLPAADVPAQPSVAPPGTFPDVPGSLVRYNGPLPPHDVNLSDVQHRLYQAVHSGDISDQQAHGILSAVDDAPEIRRNGAWVEARIRAAKGERVEVGGVEPLAPAASAPGPKLLGRPAAPSDWRPGDDPPDGYHWRFDGGQANPLNFPQRGAKGLGPPAFDRDVPGDVFPDPDSFARPDEPRGPGDGVKGAPAPPPPPVVDTELQRMVGEYVERKLGGAGMDDVELRCRKALGNVNAQKYRGQYNDEQAAALKAALKARRDEVLAGEHGGQQIGIEFDTAPGKPTPIENTLATGKVTKGREIGEGINSNFVCDVDGVGAIMKQPGDGFLSGPQDYVHERNAYLVSRALDLPGARVNTTVVREVKEGGVSSALTEADVQEMLAEGRAKIQAAQDAGGMGNREAIDYQALLARVERWRREGRIGSDLTDTWIVQEFVKDGIMGEEAPLTRLITEEEGQNICILDYLLGNTDRHDQNFMVQRDNPAGQRLVPIDHGLTFNTGVGGDSGRSAFGWDIKLSPTQRAAVQRFMDDTALHQAMMDNYGLVYDADKAAAEAQREVAAADLTPNTETFDQMYDRVRAAVAAGKMDEREASEEMKAWQKREDAQSGFRLWSILDRARYLLDAPDDAIHVTGYTRFHVSDLQGAVVDTAEMQQRKADEELLRLLQPDENWTDEELANLGDPQLAQALYRARGEAGGDLDMAIAALMERLAPGDRWMIAEAAQEGVDECRRLLAEFAEENLWQ